MYTPFGNDRSSLPPNSRSDMVGVCAVFGSPVQFAARPRRAWTFTKKRAAHGRNKDVPSPPATPSSIELDVDVICDTRETRAPDLVLGMDLDARFWHAGVRSGHAGLFWVAAIPEAARLVTSAARSSHHMKVTRGSSAPSDKHAGLRLLSGSWTAASGARDGTCSSPSVHQGCVLWITASFPVTTAPAGDAGRLVTIPVDTTPFHLSRREGIRSPLD